ncbi:uncharacterized protein LOC120277910 isoform X1 [Dioscorea cayenensis subsp. rotundata]|uniref:Uncharacterized protein LOC120277910 isoform X1 n=1 Tax=Dioscorea cayennensis subsp. rotundata TaxID=55577 RepID=A0AB40CKV6_DIOCR|nr:uncharacterized protein LOC120277910 isoform X1 [Dioscorea cayenensis subsp. rotundata]
MESSSCMGLVAVIAVSSSVALVAVQFHKRLVSDLMKKLHVELELGVGCRTLPPPPTRMMTTMMTVGKKKVRFAADVVEPSSNNEEYRRRRRRSPEMQCTTTN